jgi:hypothetical protein
MQCMKAFKNVLTINHLSLDLVRNDLLLRIAPYFSKAFYKWPKEGSDAYITKKKWAGVKLLSPTV